MDALEQHIHDVVRRDGLARVGERILVAVSGGPDSMALLHALHALRGRLRVDLWVGHVDHALRDESADDAAFVVRIASELGLDVTVARRDVAADPASDGRSLEDAARRVRYDALLSMARACGADRIATAHTADDQAETVLLRLLRGTGVAGLAAMPASRPLEERHLIRPLLQVSRHDVRAYLDAHDLASREDATNADVRFQRNRIRHELLPWLETRFNPNIRHALCQLASQCRVDAEFLSGAAQRYWKRLVKTRGAALVVRLDGYRRLPASLQRQLLRSVLQRLQGDLTGFEFRHWEELRQLVEERPVGAVTDLPGGTQVAKEREWLVLRTLRAASVDERLVQGYTERLVEPITSSIVRR